MLGGKVLANACCTYAKILHCLSARKITGHREDHAVLLASGGCKSLFNCTRCRAVQVHHATTQWRLPVSRGKQIDRRGCYRPVAKRSGDTVLCCCWRGIQKPSVADDILRRVLISGCDIADTVAVTGVFVNVQITNGCARGKPGNLSTALIQANVAQRYITLVGKRCIQIPVGVGTDRNGVNGCAVVFVLERGSVNVKRELITGHWCNTGGNTSTFNKQTTAIVEVKRMIDIGVAWPAVDQTQSNHKVIRLNVIQRKRHTVVIGKAQFRKQRRVNL